MLQMLLTGAAHDRGVQHGRKFKELIRERIHRNADLVARLDANLVADRLDRMAASLRRAVPSALEELDGIADGAEIDRRDVYLLNFGTEIAHEASEWYGCSNVAFADTPDGIIVGKNSDGDFPSPRYMAVQQTKPEAGIPVLRVVHVGGISSSGGINAAGLAYVGASIMTRDSNWDGVALAALTEALIAENSSVADAVAMARRLPVVNHSANLMLADASGAAAVVERLPQAVAVRPLVGESIFNTNQTGCIETSPFCSSSRDFAENSQARLDRLDALLQQTPRTVAGMESILSSHASPGPICQHGQDGLYTVASYICIPRRRRMLVTDSCPCQSAYRAYDFDPA